MPGPNGWGLAQTDYPPVKGTCGSQLIRLNGGSVALRAEINSVPAVMADEKSSEDDLGLCCDRIMQLHPGIYRWFTGRPFRKKVVIDLLNSLLPKHLPDTVTNV
jgi:hypothetical protein